MSSDPRQWIATLRNSHDRLESLVQPLGAEAVRDPSYCSDWTIAQVMSHLGSGAEIALLILPGALGESEPVGQEVFPPVWDIWNAKNPDAQVADGLAADEKYVRRLEQLTDDQLARIQLPFFGMDLDAVGLVRLRLGEHALHTWDVAVAADPAAAVSPDAVALLIDNVPQFIAPRLGKPQEDPLRLRIRTVEPALARPAPRACARSACPPRHYCGWPTGGWTRRIPRPTSSRHRMILTGCGRCSLAFSGLRGGRRGRVRRRPRRSPRTARRPPRRGRSCARRSARRAGARRPA